MKLTLIKTGVAAKAKRKISNFNAKKTSIYGNLL